MLTDTILYPPQIRHSPRDQQNWISINLLVLSIQIYHPTLKQVSSILTMPRLATSPQLKQRSSSPGQGSAVCGAPITAGMFVPKLPVNTEGSWFHSYKADWSLQTCFVLIVEPVHQSVGLDDDLDGGQVGVERVGGVAGCPAPRVEAGDQQHRGHARTRHTPHPESDDRRHCRAPGEYRQH